MICKIVFLSFVYLNDLHETMWVVIVLAVDLNFYLNSRGDTSIFSNPGVPNTAYF